MRDLHDENHRWSWRPSSGREGNPVRSRGAHQSSKTPLKIPVLLVTLCIAMLAGCATPLLPHPDRRRKHDDAHPTPP